MNIRPIIDAGYATANNSFIHMFVTVSVFLNKTPAHCHDQCVWALRV